MGVNPNDCHGDHRENRNNSAGLALAELHQDLKIDGVVFAMIVNTVRHQDALERMGLDKLIGEHRLFESRYACVQAYLSESAERDKSNSTASPT